MGSIYDLVITVKDQQGSCALGHKVGDKFYIRKGASPSGLCMTAMAALIPAISVLMVGGSFPWEDDPDATCRTCQDRQNPVTFEVRRLRSS
ncbi:MAG: TIGR04076 family protein [Firmicutes bacterium]|nr:TIGR04076 family protein [Bacillota bacterium]